MRQIRGASVPGYVMVTLQNRHDVAPEYRCCEIRERLRLNACDSRSLGSSGTARRGRHYRHTLPWLTIVGVLFAPLLAFAQDASVAASPGAPKVDYSSFISSDAREAEPNRFLFSLETSSPFADPLPLSTAVEVGAGAEGEAPALVPLAPPLWAGLAILVALAVARTKQHRRRTSSQYA